MAAEDDTGTAGFRPASPCERTPPRACSPSSAGTSPDSRRLAGEDAGCKPAVRAGHTFDRRGFVLGAGLLPLAVPAGSAGAPPSAWINVNLQGMEGGDRRPGRAGTDYFVPSASDLRYLDGRTSGPARLPFLWERLQHTPGGALDPTYLGHIETVADAAARNGRAVILDCHNYMHRFVGGTKHAVDGKDGIVTRGHLADLWHRLASALKQHPGVYGWDIMNEPQGLDDGQDLAAIMQAAVDAIDAVEAGRTIFVEGNRWSSAGDWVANNPDYPLHDRHTRIVYSAHCYADADASGTHFAFADMQKAGLPETVLVDRTRGFVRWCADKGVRGHIGETNVGTDDPRWANVLDQALAYWRSARLPVNLWLFAANFGPNPYNLFPVGGIEAPQWRVVARHVTS